MTSANTTQEKKTKFKSDEDSPDSLFPSKPKNGDPEWLYLSKAIRDPYSSEEEKRHIVIQKDRKVAPRRRKQQKEEALHTPKSICCHQIVKAFGINILAVTSVNCKDEDLQAYGISDVLNLFLPFITHDTATTAEDIIEAVFNHEVQSPFLRTLYELKTYTFPETYEYPNEWKQIYRCFFREHLIRLRMKLQSIEGLISTGPDPSSFLDDQLKDFFYDFLSNVSEGGMNSGVCVQKLLLERPENAHNMDSKITYESLSSKPDFVVGSSFEYAVIPVEIYSPHKYQENSTASEFSTETFEITCKDFVDHESLKHLLNTNLPSFKGSETCESVITDELTKQLLVQLLCTARAYIVENVINNGIRVTFKDERTFIGLLVHQFYVYVITLQGLEKDILIFTSAENSNFEKLCRASDSLTVQFLPICLDIRIPSHGIALLLLLKYYRRIYKC